MKHNRDQRRLIALLNMYRRYNPAYIAAVRTIEGFSEVLTLQQWWLSRELHALESRLSPEMVAWAKLNR